jgi:AraC family transcriptional regulator
MERPYSEAADVSSSINLEFGPLANSLVLLLEAAKSEIEHDQEAAKTSLATASSLLQWEMERRSGAKGSRTGGLAGWQIARVRSFIDQNLNRTIHARDLSAVARLSTAHFSRSFKQAFGEPPHAYIVRRRMEEASHLMLTSPASLSEIALSVGFSDQAHLCKLFRHAFGQSPSNWRRERRPRSAPHHTSVVDRSAGVFEARKTTCTDWHDGPDFRAVPSREP